MRCVRLTCAALVTAVLTACSSGPATGEVQGTVTFQGKAGTEGTVVLVNTTEGTGAEAQITKDGTYAVAGKVGVGGYQVIITPPRHMVDPDPGKPPRRWWTSPPRTSPRSTACR